MRGKLFMLNRKWREKYRQLEDSRRFYDNGEADEKRRRAYDLPVLARLSLFAAENAFFRVENFISPNVFRGSFSVIGCGADLAG